MIATEAIVPRKNLKIKIIKKTLDVDLGRRSCDLGQLVPLGDDQSMDTASVDCVKKRGSQAVLENQKVKKQKMDRSMTLQCSIILKKLMSHKAGWVFNHPVDPVALNIPDYFTIISKPMDLGTIKSKLEKDTYSDIEEFASDVKLTFSNAMLYNPPANLVHKMAKQLNQIFEMRWKTLAEKCNIGCLMVGPGISSCGKLKKIIDTRHDFYKIHPSHDSSLPKRSFLHGKVARCSLKSVCNAEVEHSKTFKYCKSKVSQEVCDKGTESNIKQPSGSVIANQPCNTAAPSICGKCNRLDCCCSLPSDSAHTSSDISSERSWGSINHACNAEISRLDFKAITIPGINFKVEVKLTSQPTKSDPDSDGAVSALDDENLCPSSQLMTPVTGIASSEGWNPTTFDVPLSPKRALRAAILKSRFADTILKAQQKTLLDHGDTSDFAKKQKEKQRLEMIQREEKARIEAQRKAAEAVSRMKEEIKLKQQREKEREAARIVLEQIEKTVEIDQNMEALKELEILSGHDKSSRTATGTPYLLQKLGLFMKDEYAAYNVYEDEDGFFVEEGEIF